MGTTRPLKPSIPLSTRRVRAHILIEQPITATLSVQGCHGGRSARGVQGSFAEGRPYVFEANPSICECSTTKMTGGHTCDEDGMADITLTGKSKFEREAQTMRANEQWARANPRSGILIGGSPRRPKDRTDVFRGFRDPGSDCKAIKERLINVTTRRQSILLGSFSVVFAH